MNLSMPNNTNSPSRSPTTATSTNNNNELIAEIAAKGKSTLKKTAPRPSGSVMMFTEKGMVPMTPASPPTPTAATSAITSENNTTPAPNTTTPSAVVATNEQTSKAPVVPAAQQPPRLKVGCGNTDDFSLKEASATRRQRLIVSHENNSLLEIEEEGNTVDKGNSNAGSNKGTSREGIPVKKGVPNEVSMESEEISLKEELGMSDREHSDDSEENVKAPIAKPLPNNINGKIDSFLKMSQKEVLRRRNTTYCPE